MYMFHSREKIIYLVVFRAQLMNRFGVRCYRYLAAKSEEDHYKKELKREQDEIIAVPDIGFYLIILTLFLSDKFSAETVVLYSFSDAWEIIS